MPIGQMSNFDELFRYGLGTKGINNVSVVVNTATLTNCDGIKLHVEMDPRPSVLRNPDGTWNFHREIRKYSRSFSSAAEQELTDLPVIADDAAYRAIHILEPGSSVITEYSLELNNATMFDRVSDEAMSAINENSHRTEQSGYFSVPFDRKNQPDDFLPMRGASNFFHKINWTVAAPNTYDIMADVVRGVVAPAK